MRANEGQAGSRKLPILGQALLRFQCPFVGWKGRHDLEKGEEKKCKLYLTIFLSYTKLCYLKSHLLEKDHQIE